MSVFLPLLFIQAAAAPVTEVDPNTLSIGRHGLAHVAPGQLFDLRSNKPCTMDDVVKAAEGKRFVFLGENHATTLHQQMEANVIRALDAAHRKVAVGMEMFQRPVQNVLDQWSKGVLSDDEFVEKADWKRQWGYPYGFYKPVFDAVKDLHLPLIGLNVPRTWVHAVGTGGFKNLPIEAKMQLPVEPPIYNKTHREVFNAMVGPHNMPGVNPDNMYAAQVLWDVSMGDTAVKYEAVTNPGPDNVFVVIAGSGHVMYGQGINFRIQKRHAGTGVTLVMMQADKPVDVARGIGDFVYVTQTQADQK